MFAPTLYQEEKNKNKGLRISATFHIIIILLALWPFMIDNPNQDVQKQFAIEIVFDRGAESNSFKGKAAEGAQRPKNENIEEVESPKVNEIPTKTTPPPIKQPKVETAPTKTSTKTQSDIFDDNTDVFASSESELETNEIPKSTKKSTTKSTSVSVSDNSENVESVPVQVPGKTGSSGSGSKSTSGASNKDGTGTGQGSKGAGTGSDKTGNDKSSGEGTGGKSNKGAGPLDESGKGIFGRQPVYRPPINEIPITNGQIVFRVCIDNKGKTNYVTVLEDRSTIKDKKIIKQAMDYMYKFIWEEDYRAGGNECGIYTLKVSR